MKPISANDKFFLRLVEIEELLVTEVGHVFNLKSNKEIGFITKGYKRINMYGKTMAVHRLVYLVHIGEIPEGFTIDHLDCNKLNNHFKNLEAVAYGENNKRAFKKSIANCRY